MASTVLPAPRLNPRPPYHRLNGWERLLLGVLAGALCFLAFAMMMRSCFMQRRMTDAGCYFRGAWAVRAGVDMYQVVDNNDWHYNYPPFLAILMVPLADAPAGLEHTNLLPYPVSTALWFLINVAAWFLAVHWLARAVEKGSADPWVRHTPRGSREWWRRRMLPALLCLLPAGHSLMRGQVNLLILLLYTGMMVMDVYGHKARAGMFLALAISIKIIPLFLLVYPLWRRDWRFLGGCAATLVVTLAFLPGVVLGPQRTADSYVELVNAVLKPGLTHHSEDESRFKELTNITSTDNQSFVAVLHYTLYPNTATRPAQASAVVRLGTLSVGALMTLVTLLVARRRRASSMGSGVAPGMMGWAMLVLVMMFSSPMSHSHYYCWCIPLFMGLAAVRPPRGRAWLGWAVLSTVFVCGMLLPHLPPTAFLRDFGIVTLPGVVLWCVAAGVLAQENRPAPVVSELALAGKADFVTARDSSVAA